MNNVHAVPAFLNAIIGYDTIFVGQNTGIRAYAIKPYSWTVLLNTTLACSRADCVVYISAEL